jgi:two-component system response regulator HydG
MQQVYRLVHKVSHAGFPVLIMGESGTGKELIARALHDLGIRRKCPFVPVDCAALVSTLVESELFGYVKGAFTGAESPRRGLLRSASGGTVFLDEIGEMPLNMQAKLLRALQEHEIRPVGSNQYVPIDMRIVAATSRDLASEVGAGRFRQDLYFRLNVMQINLPPLRMRKGDVPLLAESFRVRFIDYRPEVTSISERAMNRLIAYDWPGNVRELKNAIEHAMALGLGPTIELNDLPNFLLDATIADGKTEEETAVTLAQIEHKAILRALLSARGDKLAAARALGIGKTTLYRRLSHYSKAGNRTALTPAAR